MIIERALAKAYGEASTVHPVRWSRGAMRRTEYDEFVCCDVPNSAHHYRTDRSGSRIPEHLARVRREIWRPPLANRSMSRT